MRVRSVGGGTCVTTLAHPPSLSLALPSTYCLELISSAPPSLSCPPPSSPPSFSCPPPSSLPPTQALIEEAQREAARQRALLGKAAGAAAWGQEAAWRDELSCVPALQRKVQRIERCARALSEGVS